MSDTPAILTGWCTLPMVSVRPTERSGEQSSGSKNVMREAAAISEANAPTRSRFSAHKEKAGVVIDTRPWSQSMLPAMLEEAGETKTVVTAMREAVILSAALSSETREK